MGTLKFVGDCHQGPTFSCADKGSGAKGSGEAVPVVKNVVVDKGRRTVSI
jgi:hypothetical protein